MCAHNHIRNLWYSIEEDVTLHSKSKLCMSFYRYGKKEVVRISNDNEQSYLKVDVSDESLCFACEYTHIEAFLNDFAPYLNTLTSVEVIQPWVRNKRTREDNDNIIVHVKRKK